MEPGQNLDEKVGYGFVACSLVIFDKFGIQFCFPIIRVLGYLFSKFCYCGLKRSDRVNLAMEHRMDFVHLRHDMVVERLIKLYHVQRCRHARAMRLQPVFDFDAYAYDGGQKQISGGLLAGYRA